ncbi:MAG: winged helix-turn-helix domain-containing protein, partial [Vulcanisaeta sp.]
VGVPYDRLIRYLSELKNLGLIRWEPYSGVYLTSTGLEAIINAQSNRNNLVLILTRLAQSRARVAT